MNTAAFKKKMWHSFRCTWASLNDVKTGGLGCFFFKQLYVRVIIRKKTDGLWTYVGKSTIYWFMLFVAPILRISWWYGETWFINFITCFCTVWITNWIYIIIRDFKRQLIIFLELWNVSSLWIDFLDTNAYIPIYIYIRMYALINVWVTL